MRYCLNYYSSRPNLIENNDFRSANQPTPNYIKMHSFAVIATTLAVSIAMVKADYIEEDDIPQQCQDVCRPVWQASAGCNDAADGEDDDGDNDGDGEDNVSEVNCICSTQNFNNVIPECELCVRPYYPQDGDYDSKSARRTRWV